MLILNRDATAAALTHAECVAALEPAMASVSKGGAQLPLRNYLEIPGTAGKFTVMPGYLADPRTFGVKIVSKFPRPSDSPLSSHVGAVMVFDADQGLPLALLDGAELTAIRTAAASALATRELARPDARVLGILGNGEEAWHHALAVIGVRDIQRILVWGRSPDRAAAFAERLGAQVDAAVSSADREQIAADADIVCTVTSAPRPILAGALLQPGTHVNLVGAAVRTSAEADAAVVTRSRFFTDFRGSALAQAGELLDAIEAGLVDESHIVAEIGEVLAGTADGRLQATDITVYKSLGVAAQDLAAGLAAYGNARDRGLGVEVPW